MVYNKFDFNYIVPAEELQLVSHIIELIEHF